jgi:hypothetical protein
VFVLLQFPKSARYVANHHKKIRFIEGNAKCRHQKKFPCKGTLRQVFICLRPRTPYIYTSIPLPLHTVRVYSILFTQGRGKEGEVEPERRFQRQQFTQLGPKYQHDWLYLQSVNSDKHLSQSPSTGQIF